jgi:hypothetical protein
MLHRPARKTAAMRKVFSGSLMMRDVFFFRARAQVQSYGYGSLRTKD